MDKRRASEVDCPIDRLKALGERLRADGWYAQVLLDSGRAPVLRVVNPAALPLNDDVTAGQDETGAWSFRWSFGRPIARADDLHIAAASITRVLGCDSG